MISSSLIRAVILAFALREYLRGSTPPSAGLKAQHGEGSDDAEPEEQSVASQPEVKEGEDRNVRTIPEPTVESDDEIVDRDVPREQDDDGLVVEDCEQETVEQLDSRGACGLRILKPALQPPRSPVKLERLDSTALLNVFRSPRPENPQDAEREEREPKAKNEDLSVGSEPGHRNVWHDSQAIAMNVALRAIPLVQAFLIAVVLLEIATRVFSDSFFAKSVVQSTALPVLCPSPNIPRYTHALSSTNFHILTTPLTPRYLLAASLVIIGSRIRIRCFQEMEGQFTFTHTTLKDHRLITSGPYSIVRHPSYTGVLFAYLSMAALTFMQGSWIRQCAVVPNQARTLHEILTLTFVGTVWTASVFYMTWDVVVTFGLMLRAPREDETLRERFGKDWEIYRERVPARFIPFLL